MQNTQDMLAKGRGRNAKGEKSGRHKLTALQVAVIRQRWLQGGISKNKLAHEYGVCRSTLTALLVGHTWK